MNQKFNEIVTPLSDADRDHLLETVFNADWQKQFAMRLEGVLEDDLIKKFVEGEV